MKQLTETKLQLAIGRTLTQGQISLSKFGKGNVKKHCSKLMFKAFTISDLQIFCLPPCLNFSCIL